MLYFETDMLLLTYTTSLEQFKWEEKQTDLKGGGQPDHQEDSEQSGGHHETMSLITTVLQ